MRIFASLIDFKHWLLTRVTTFQTTVTHCQPNTHLVSVQRERLSEQTSKKLVDHLQRNLGQNIL